MITNRNIAFALKEIKNAVKDKELPVAELIKVQTGAVWKVLVAALLSARTKDGVTAAAAGRLFKEIKNIKGLNDLSLKRIEKLIYPVGFYRQKARYLKSLPDVLVKRYGGKIPDDINDLLQLPGIGRKTANLIRSAAFGKPAICVDTHVHRIMNLWGYVKTRTPLETEKVLRKKLPQKYWADVNYLLVSYGQSVCRPVKPRCGSCVLRRQCPEFSRLVRLQ